MIKKQSIEDYVMKNAGSKKSFENWYSILKVADWNKPSDILSTFNSADILGQGSKRVVFNIGGNNYRIICTYYFGETKVHIFVKWVGTHAEYNRLCKDGKQYDINVF